MSIEDVKAHLTKEIARSDQAIKAHTDMLAKNPVHAFEWADAAFTAAARHEVMTNSLRHLDTTTGTLETLKAAAMHRALRGARYPARSTSPSSRIMAQETAAAWAELLEVLEGA